VGARVAKTGKTHNIDISICEECVGVVKIIAGIGNLG